jgi:hypothetical protein
MADGGYRDNLDEYCHVLWRLGGLPGQTLELQGAPTLRLQPWYAPTLVNSNRPKGLKISTIPKTTLRAEDLDAEALVWGIHFDV